MSEPIKVLRALTDDEVIARHDAVAVHTGAGVSFYLDELRRREQARVIAASNRLARAAFWLTVTNTALALVAIVVTASLGETGVGDPRPRQRGDHVGRR